MGGKYGNKRAIAPEREPEVIELYLTTHCMQKCAAVYGVNSETVRRILIRNGIPRRKPKQPKKHKHLWDDSLTPRAVEMYENGVSCKEIGSKLGYSQSTIYKRLKSVGVVKDAAPRLTQEQVSEISSLCDAGLTNREIAERFGIAPQSVSRAALRNGCSPRGKGGNSRNGGLAVGIKRRAEYLKRFDSMPNGFTCLDKSDYESVVVRCDRCGNTFTWSRETWRALEPCPTCRAEKAAQKHAEYERKADESRQQREAAREWRESVPQICKECSEPFYSDRDGSYCCDVCRRKAANRRKPRTHRRGKGVNAYKHRMRIKVTPVTFDRTITLNAVYKKYHGRCCNCGCKTVRSKEYRPDRATLDHIVALGNYGTHTWDNVQLLCTSCNSDKRDLGQMRLAIAV